ncbi:hypothetical protein D3C72_914400 [compost metagenome]
MPVGQVLLWHWRIITQPAAIRSAVPKAYSSAPKSAATTTSRPVLRPPSALSRTRPRRSLRTSTCWASARPSSHGTPACLIEPSGLAPVPPSWPLMWMTSAWALATPAAIVPTPATETSFTATRARGLIARRS